MPDFPSAFKNIGVVMAEYTLWAVWLQINRTSFAFLQMSLLSVDYMKLENNDLSRPQNKEKRKKCTC